MNHGELCARAQRWVRARRYPIVLCDVRTVATAEQPDAIGFRYGDTLLVECKATRSDFLRDAKKLQRRVPAMGMGYFRWYFTNPLVCFPAELPAGWGLAIAAGRSVTVIKGAQPFVERNLLEEQRLLITALRRATEGWGQRMFGDRAPALGGGGS